VGSSLKSFDGERERSVYLLRRGNGTEKKGESIILRAWSTKKKKEKRERRVRSVSLPCGGKAKRSRTLCRGGERLDLLRLEKTQFEGKRTISQEKKRKKRAPSRLAAIEELSLLEKEEERSPLLRGDP